jgi:hypothetical protein
MRFLLLAALLALAGCGRFDDVLNRQASDTTEVKFVPPRVQDSSGRIMPLSTLNGGVLIYAVNANEPFRRGAKKLGNEFDGLSWKIPTAAYIFYGVGYEGSGLANTPPMHCGKTGPITLNGSPVTIQLTLDQNNCGSPPFSKPTFNTGNQPMAITVATCSNNSAQSAPGNCGANTSWGSVSGATITLPEYNGFSGQIETDNNGGLGISSSCTALSTPTVPQPTNAKIPTGDNPPGDPFLAVFNTYNSTTCGPSAMRAYVLMRSLANAGNANFSFFSNNQIPFNFGGNPNPVLVGVSGSIYVYLRDLN